MSRYEVNKVLRRLLSNDAEERRFFEDPGAFIAGYALTGEEKQALARLDYGALYALGAHPMPLYRWARKVHLHLGGAMTSFAQDYEAAIAPHGRPDFST